MQVAQIPLNTIYFAYYVCKLLQTYTNLLPIQCFTPQRLQCFKFWWYVYFVVDGKLF